MKDRDLLLIAGLAAGAYFLTRRGGSTAGASQIAPPTPASEQPFMDVPPWAPPVPALSPLPVVDLSDPNAYSVFTAPGVPANDPAQALAWLAARFQLPAGVTGEVTRAPSWISPYGVQITFPGLPTRIALVP